MVLDPLLVDPVAGIGPHHGVDDRDGMEALLAEIGHHTLGIGEPCLVPGEDAIAVHEVNVEKDAIARNLPMPKVLGNKANGAFGKIAVAALDVAQGPARRQRNTTDKFSVAADYLFGVGTTEEVVVELSPFRTKRVDVGEFRPHVELRSPRVIQEDAVRTSPAEGKEEGNRLVKRLRRRVKAFRIVVPHHQGTAALIERSALLSEAKIVLVFWFPLPHPDAVPVPGDALGVRVLRQQLAVHVVKSNAEGAQLNSRLQLLGANCLILAVAGEIDLDAGPIRFHHSIRVIGRQRGCVSSPNADQIGSEDLHDDRRPWAAKGELVAFPASWSQASDRLPFGLRQARKQNSDNRDLKAAKNWLHTSPVSKGTAPNNPALFPSCAATIRTFPHGVQACSWTKRCR